MTAELGYHPGMGTTRRFHRKLKADPAGEYGVALWRAIDSRGLELGDVVNATGLSYDFLYQLVTGRKLPSDETHGRLRQLLFDDRDAIDAGLKVERERRAGTQREEKEQIEEILDTFRNLDEHGRKLMLLFARELREGK